MIISSRVRLARNIEGYPFLLNDERADRLVNSIITSLRKIDKFTLYRMSEFSPASALAMMERHLISPDLIKNKRYGAVALNDDESVSIMINEEDHIRSQCIFSGFSVRAAYNRISMIDRTLAGEIKFSVDPRVGYITACATNSGTGMRASVMMFLPALTLSGNLEKIAQSIGGIMVRGVYGEGSQASGFVYQISNKISDTTEEQIITLIENAANHIIKAEHKAREYLYNNSGLEVENKIMRAYGILTNCRLLSHSELIELAAFLKLGSYYGLLICTDPQSLEELIMETAPAHISALIGAKNINERDATRAQIVTSQIKKIFSVK